MWSSSLFCPASVYGSVPAAISAALMYSGCPSEVPAYASAPMHSPFQSVSIFSSRKGGGRRFLVSLIFFLIAVRFSEVYHRFAASRDRNTNVCFSDGVPGLSAGFSFSLMSKTVKTSSAYSPAASRSSSEVQRYTPPSVLSLSASTAEKNPPSTACISLMRYSAVSSATCL